MRSHYLGAVLIAGCGDPVPEQVAYDDIARVVGATIATPDHGATMGAVNDSIVLAFGAMPGGFTYESGTAYGEHGSLEHRYIMIQCRDRENRLLKPCNQMTNMATLIASWSGAIDSADLDVRSSRQGMWTLGNLQTWMPTITGSSSVQVDGTVGDRAVALTASATETMVTPGYMMGGAIHLDITVTEPAPATMTADVVFDDLGRTASLTIDGELYRIDLASGDVE